MIPLRRLMSRRRRPLPAPDASIDALTAEERATATAIWLGRAESELRAAASFTVIADELLDLTELGALARRAIDDERRHSEICWEVACAFAGALLPEPRRLPLVVPRGTRAEHLAGMCCLNETTANAFHELTRAGARGTLVCAALHELAADEIDHARIGWAFLAGVDAETRTTLAARLPELLDANLRSWRNRPRFAITPALVEQGCPTWDAVDAAVVGAIDDLLLPGFEHVGIDTRAARAWLAAR